MTPPVYQPWFEGNPTRFQEETRILTDYGFTLNREVLEQQGRVEFQGFLPVDPTRLLLIKFSASFPSMPPMAFDTEDSALLPRHHTSATRQFCLFGIQDSRWRADKSSRDVIDELQDLIQKIGIEKITLDGDSVPEPLSADLPYLPNLSVLVPPPFSSFEISDHPSATGELTLSYTTGSPLLPYGRAVVISAKLNGETIKLKENYEGLLWQNSTEIDAKLIFCPGPSTRDSLVNLIFSRQRALPEFKRKKAQWFALVFIEQSGSVTSTRVAWLFARLDPDGKIHWIRTFAYRPEERLARIPNLSPIRNQRIALIGCGCLGSKIGVHLAASGAEYFTPVDRDFMDPYNSVRHEVGVSFFGAPKSFALAYRLREISPEVRADSQYFIIGSLDEIQVQQRFHEALSTAKIIIDTTGSHGVSRWINDFAFAHGIPAIFVSVTNGAWGGEIVRTVPGKTACWICWANQYSEFAPPGERAPAIFPPGCNQPSFTGTSYDTSFVAALASSLIVDTLSDKRSYNGDYIRWTGRDENGPILKTEILMVNRSADCPFCGSQ